MYINDMATAVATVMNACMYLNDIDLERVIAMRGRMPGVSATPVATPEVPEFVPAK